MFSRETHQNLNHLLEQLQAEGLSLLFDDGSMIDLTRNAVRCAAERIRNEPDALPPGCRAAVEFAPCRVCPARAADTMCHALPAIVPFLEQMDRHTSHEEVTAAFVERDGEHDRVHHLSRTTLQRALQYVAMQSVLNYCETGLRFQPYFRGVIPFTTAESIAERIYANAMLEANGDPDAVNRTLDAMRKTFAITLECQTRRVRLVSQSDVFVNAFVNLYIALDLLRPERRDRLRQAAQQQP